MDGTANKEERDKGLCWRCEHRAVAHETGSGPRCECKDFSTAYCGCYMYRPVRPLVIKAITYGRGPDIRPLGGPPMIAARANRVGIGDVELAGTEDKNGLFMYWRPVTKKPGEETYGKERSSKSGRGSKGKPARRKRTPR